MSLLGPILCFFLSDIESFSLKKGKNQINVYAAQEKLFFSFSWAAKISKAFFCLMPVCKKHEILYKGFFAIFPPCLGYFCGVAVTFLIKRMVLPLPSGKTN